jgi:hypothetical protein
MSFCTYNLQANHAKKDLENLAKAFGFEMEEEKNLVTATERINLRLTPVEKESIKEKFQLYRKGRGKYSLTRFILDRCLSFGKPIGDHKKMNMDQSTLNSILTELLKQGNNINQVAKKMNSVPDNKVIYNEAQNLKTYLNQNLEVIETLHYLLKKAK